MDADSIFNSDNSGVSDRLLEHINTNILRNRLMTQTMEAHMMADGDEKRVEESLVNLTVYCMALELQVDKLRTMIKGMQTHMVRYAMDKGEQDEY